MARFIALPVGQGDAFFLETDKGSVLVDGGRAIDGFATLFREHTGRDDVDILVVTHNDADHANGVLGFLKAGFRCREIWLPGRWAEVLPHVLRPWEEVVYILIPQVERAIAELGERLEVLPGETLLERYAETLENQRFENVDERERGEELEFGESGWPPLLISQLEQAAEEEDFWGFLWPPFSPPRLWLGSHLELYRYYQQRLFVEAIVAAKRIRQIAIEAFHRGIPVRWFEFDPMNSGGGLAWLQPLNSRQVVRVRRIPAETLFHIIALTVYNRESLVFWVLPPYAGPGVLFTADSDLGSVCLPSLDGAIVTAPHHGSEANKRVYKIIPEHTTNVTWVRSDGRFRKRPCKDYINAPGRKFCTLCRNPKFLKQAVRLFSDSQAWSRYPDVRSCVCR